MKRIPAFLLALALLLCGCGGAASSGASRPQATATKAPAVSESDPESSAPTSTPEASAPAGKILVICFSCTEHTMAVAEAIAAHYGAELYRLEPAEPYTSADRDWNDKTSRTSVEMNDPAARPAIAEPLPDLAGYDTVFLGYPIWWGQAPRIIQTLLESVDLGSRTVIPFCTSASSGIGSSAQNLHSLAPEANWLDGRRFSQGQSEADVTAWLEELPLG